MAVTKGGARKIEWSEMTAAEQREAKPRRMDSDDTREPKMVVAMSIAFPLPIGEDGVPLRVRDIKRMANALEAAQVDEMAIVHFFEDERGQGIEVGF